MISRFESVRYSLQKIEQWSQQNFVTIMSCKVELAVLKVTNCLIVEFLRNQSANMTNLKQTGENTEKKVTSMQQMNRT
jgi:hypothetical protein